MKSLHLAQAEDFDRLIALAHAHHEELGQDSTPEALAAALEPLLTGVPHGAAWLIGPRRAPVGYVAVSFGWCIAHGGLEARVDELFIRPAVRGRGMAREALLALGKALRDGGVAVLHLKRLHDDPRGTRIGRAAGFTQTPGHDWMTRIL